MMPEIKSLSVPENNFVSLDYRVYGELMATKAIADAFKALIRNKKDNYGEITRTEIELLYVLYCEQAGEEK